jgi:Protein of Unknown function (DUF2784)
MLYQLLANAVVIVHVGFIVFVVLGGFLAWRWRRIAWLHIPTALYGATIEFVGWVCPLTPLENHFRRLAGQSGYTGGFIEHYIIPVLYPTDWTVSLRVILGTLVLLVNALAYGVYFWRIAKSRPPRPTQRT